jgi:glutamate racemase
LTEEKTLSSELIYEGRAVRLRVDTVQMPYGRKSTREIVEHAAEFRGTHLGSSRPPGA